MNNQLETEVKFHAANPEGTRERLSGLGAEFMGRVFETNAIWDTN